MEFQITECRKARDGDEDSGGANTDFLTGPSVTTKTIAAAFKDVSEFQNALGAADSGSDTTEPSARFKERSLNNAKVNGNFPSDQDDSEIDEHETVEDKTSVNVIHQHLLLLAEHPSQFLERLPATSTAREQWAVDFPEMMQSHLCNTLFATISHRFGTLSARLAKICHEKGRVDEKILSDLSLLTAKEVRARLLSLQKAGLLELQEVPRDNARVASRTHFLYFFDEDKCSKKIIEDCHKTMLRCLQRLRVEKEKVAGLLEKLERTDVQGREDELLGAMEKQGLQKWRELEERILGEVGRLDDTIAILQDF